MWFSPTARTRSCDLVRGRGGGGFALRQLDLAVGEKLKRADHGHG